MGEGGQLMKNKPHTASLFHSTDLLGPTQWLPERFSLVNIIYFATVILPQDFSFFLRV